MGLVKVLKLARPPSRCRTRSSRTIVVITLAAHLSKDLAQMGLNSQELLSQSEVV